MEETNRPRLRFVQLCQYLHEPTLVARFQQFCGVRGTFSSNSVDTAAEVDRTHSHNNCVCSNLTCESGKCIAKEGGEGKLTSEGPRQRSVPTTENSLAADGHKHTHNGAVVTPPAGGESAGHCKNGRSPADASGGPVRDGSGVNCSSVTEDTKSECTPPSTVLKPRRKNSLTGEAGQEFLIENQFFYFMFTLGTELGNELFFITFFPFLMWNVDAYVSRRVLYVWTWVMYLGQCTKDVIRWPRPASPPVVKVEMFYNSEYSMPSTHAMSGTAVPIALFLLSHARWEYPWALGFSLALIWCVLVCISRIYMGMHSVLDVIAGFLFSLLILLVILPLLDQIDSFNQTCRYAPLIIISSHLALALFSFTLDTWSTSRGDTAQVLGTGAGVALASHANYMQGVNPDHLASALPLTMPTLGVGLATWALVRFVLGVLVLLATRSVMKALVIPLACRLSGIPGDDVRKARQNMEVELPYRYVVYGTVGFMTLYLVPQVFVLLGLS